MTCKILKKWVNLEMEHTKNRFIARKIVEDHVNEYGCKYYPELIEMEKELKNGKKKSKNKKNY